VRSGDTPSAEKQNCRLSAPRVREGGAFQAKALARPTGEAINHCRMLRDVEAGQTEIVLDRIVVSFDGRVLELFGHASQRGNRIHVALITGIRDEGDKIVISTRGQFDYSVMLTGADSATRARLDSLMEEVRRSAPNVEGR
jgi:hypothetical protein